MKIGVCIKAKDEQKIICDWVSHYLNLGFDKIFIYDNMSNPTIEDSLAEKNLLNDKINIKIYTGFVNHKGRVITFNQAGVYNECINQNKDLDWILLCDADEFLWIKEGTIKDFLSKFSKNTATVLVNWLVYGTSNLQKYDTNKSVFEQFVFREKYTHFWNRFVKSFIRPALIDKVGNVHITFNNMYETHDVYNNDISKTAHRLRENNKGRLEVSCTILDRNLNERTPLVLVHYMTLDFESMLDKNKRNYNSRMCSNQKYSLEWYQGKYIRNQGFKDEIKDLRMLKYSN